MGIQAGGLLGIYEILSPLGAGGMGEVYRARDTRLNRDVALKVLPEAVAHDPERMVRFEREARTLASLNHPNIAAIYGLEESQGSGVLVMELVEGETLAERIARSSNSRTSSRGSHPGLPIEECLGIAKQIAEALEYAHEQAIVHRDLKPANVKITPVGAVKVLDFGLAKVLKNEDSAPVDPMNSPTLSAMATQAGIILGTVAYMAPEQAKGKQVDRRADIWAFGCVLYEMLSGQKAFVGDSTSDVLAAVIKSEPDWSALPADTPPVIERLVRRCLQKDVRQRLQAIGDARIAIEEVLSGTSDNAAPIPSDRIAKRKRTTSLRRALPWALGVTTILFAAIAGFSVFQPKPPQTVVRFSLSPPENAKPILGGMMSVSPDGRMLAFVAEPAPGKSSVLWLRSLDNVTAAPIAGTEGASLPFWSPDSQWIGFTANGKLDKVAVTGGSVEALCDAHGGGGTWSRDGVILFADRDGLYRVPDTGGTPTLLFALDPAHQVVGYNHPQFLPDGRHFLVQVNTPATETNILGAGSLDSKTLGHLARINSEVDYAEPGYLFYTDQSTLKAQPFDDKELRFSGPAVPIAQNIGQAGPSYGYFSVSSAGVLAYQSGTNESLDAMAWFDRNGQKLGTLGQPGIYTDPRISPDGTRLVVVFRETFARTTYDVWIYDLKHGTGSRLTFTTAFNDNPAWSPDGRSIFFSSKRNGKTGIYQKRADGMGNEQLVYESDQLGGGLDGLSPDGRYAMYMDLTPAQSEWVLPLGVGGKPFAWLRDSFKQDRAMFSPNGRYVAYASSETGRPEVYVQTFPEHLGKWQISVSGGDQPAWRSDGKELFYAGTDSKIMSVDVRTGSGSFEASLPKPLFEQPLRNNASRNGYAVSPDGQRFLMIVPAGSTAQEPITVVLNWSALLNK
jgi:serine/threonine protein kinase/Tol biopolymer transport system component